MGTRVPGLPISNCAGSCNNLVTRVTKVSAIDVTKSILCVFVLVSGLALFGLESSPHTPTVHLKTISRFPNILPPLWPLNFCQHTIHRVIWPSLGTLAATTQIGQSLAILDLGPSSKSTNFETSSSHGIEKFNGTLFRSS